MSNFFPALRRREIIKHAKYVGAADSDDLSRWLIAWVWHNQGAKDQIWSVMECARNIGRKITEDEAAAIVDEAAITPKRWSADNLGRFLGVIHSQRKLLGITTIAGKNVPKQARKELRKRDDRLRAERKRRANGAIPRDEYEANSVTAQAAAEGVSRMTIHRRRKAEQAKNQPNVTSASAPILLSSEDGPVTSRRKGPSEEGLTLRGKVISLSTDPLAADGVATLSLELRMAALCLPMPETRMAA